MWWVDKPFTNTLQEAVELGAGGERLGGFDGLSRSKIRRGFSGIAEIWWRAGNWEGLCGLRRTTTGSDRIEPARGAKCRGRESGVLAVWGRTTGLCADVAWRA